MSDQIQQLVQRMHDCRGQVVVAVAGAGTEFLCWLFRQPGASRTVLEATIPYGRLATIDMLGHEPDRYVSPETSRDMAHASYKRALLLRESSEPVVGLACTATIATDRPKRGDHRCSVAAWHSTGVTTYDLVLAKGYRDRAGEEEVCSRILLNSLAHCMGIESVLAPDLLSSERLVTEHRLHPDPLGQLMDQPGLGARWVTVYPDGQRVAEVPARGAILSGSFRPLHQGHEKLAQVAAELLEAPVTFELSVVNVDKPPLEQEEVLRRLEQFRGKEAVVLTRAPRFVEKARLFPGCTFIIGWDTAVRLVDSHYYGDSEQEMYAALGEMRALGCRFLVAGRLYQGSYRTLADIAIPSGIGDLFHPIPESRFRVDVSSTQLREENNGDSGTA